MQKIKRLYLVSVAEHIGLGRTWVLTTKTGILATRLRCAKSLFYACIHCTQLLYHVTDQDAYQIILCLLKSGLQGKALITHVDIARLDERFNMRSQSRAW